jgi:preprotein translocase subunit SecE
MGREEQAREQHRRTRWTTRHKLIATAIVVDLLVLPIVLLFAVGAGAATTTGGPVSTP